MIGTRAIQWGDSPSVPEVPLHALSQSESSLTRPPECLAESISESEVAAVLERIAGDAWVILLRNVLGAGVLRGMLSQFDQSVTADWLATTLALQARSLQREPVSAMPPPSKRKSVTRLLQRWMADETGYDEKVWPKIRTAIQENRESYRDRFGD